MDKAREKKIFFITFVGFFINLFLTLGKLLAGFFGKSGAMIADAVHSFSDFITDVIVLVFIKAANKPTDEDHHYGHGKFETLATVLIGLALFAVGVALLVNGAKQIGLFLKGEIIEQPGLIAVIAAAVSIVVKEGLYWYTSISGKKLNSSAVVANAWHHRSDAFSSIGALIGISGARFLGEKWRVLDPFAAIVVSALIIVTALKLIKPSIDELLEKSLSSEDKKTIFDIINGESSVYSPHNLKTRKVGNYFVIECHIRVDGKMSVNDSHSITVNLENKIKDKFGELTHVIIHVEPLKSEG